jgi:hypothetical protein
MDEHPVWSKTCSIHPDTRRKKRIQKFNHLPLYFGCEMWMGYGKMWIKNTLVFEYLGRYDMY